MHVPVHVSMPYIDMAYYLLAYCNTCSNIDMAIAWFSFLSSKAAKGMLHLLNIEYYIAILIAIQ